MIAFLRSANRLKNPEMYLLSYLAVGCCDKSSCVVDVTSDHIVGEVGLQDKVLGINLKL